MLFRSRGWQYARWNRTAPYDRPPYQSRRDPALTPYRFPGPDVR